MGATSPGQWDLLPDEAIGFTRDNNASLVNTMNYDKAHALATVRSVIAVTYSDVTRNALAPRAGQEGRGHVAYRWAKMDEKGTEWKRSVALAPTPAQPVAVEWVSPTNGTYQVEIGVDHPRSSMRLQLVGPEGKALWQASPDAKNPSSQASLKVPLKEGQCIRLEAEAAKANSPSPEVTRFEVSLAPSTNAN